MVSEITEITETASHTAAEKGKAPLESSALARAAEALESDANAQAAEDAFKPNFENTVSIEWSKFQEEVTKSQHAEASLLVRPKYETNCVPLFAEARRVFQNDVEPALLKKMDLDGRIFNYCLGKPEALKKMNELFGFLKGQTLAVRKESLTALLLLPTSELNCEAEMWQRLDIIHRAARGSQALLVQAFEEAAASRTGGEIHGAHAAINDLGLKPHVEKHLESFLGGVLRFVEELKAAIAQSSDVNEQVKKIQAVHEKHLPTLSLFFPLKKKEADSSVSDELHQHNRVFRIG
jgi:hypothetical protein